jgi:hypothetical protein
MAALEYLRVEVLAQIRRMEALEHVESEDVQLLRGMKVQYLGDGC